MKNILIVMTFLWIFSCNHIFCEDSIPITISSNIFYGNVDEWLHLKITDTLNNQVWYDSLATVSVLKGFQDTVYLNKGTYKCEVIDIGANVSMPIIKLNNGYIAPWGYPRYQYYLFSVPGGDLNTYHSISDTACNTYTSPSSKYKWTESGTYFDTIPNIIGHDSIITIKLTIIKIDNTINLSDGVLTAVEANANYEWFVCNYGNSINGANGQNYKPIVNGLYSVKITKNGCVSISQCYGVIMSGIAKPEKMASISLYPNPVSDILTIDFNKFYNHIQIEVKDLNGKIVSSEFYRNQNNIQYNMENYITGTYFIQLKADNNDMVFKIIKK